MYEIKTDYKCLISYVFRILNENYSRSRIGLYCVHDSFIDYKIYYESSQLNFTSERIEYPFSNFIDIFMTKDSLKYFKYDDILVLLSCEKDHISENYNVHIFDIVDDMMFWVDKFYVNTTNKTLRKYKPMISLDSTNVIMLVEESETICFIVSSNLKFKDYILKTTKRVMYAYPVFGSQLYLSHYNDTQVSIYKLYKYQENNGLITISIELIRMHNFTQIYCGFDIDFSGIALVFTQPNNIFVYQVKSVYAIDCLCRLNFFKYKNEFTFITNNDNTDRTYSMDQMSKIEEFKQ